MSTEIPWVSVDSCLTLLLKNLSFWNCCFLEFCYVSSDTCSVADGGRPKICHMYGNAMAGIPSQIAYGSC